MLNPMGEEKLAGAMQDLSPLSLRGCTGESLEERLANLVVSTRKATGCALVFLCKLHEQEGEVTAYYSIAGRDEPPWHKTKWLLDQETISLLTGSGEAWKREVSRLLLAKLVKKNVASLVTHRIRLDEKITGFLGIGAFEPGQLVENKKAILDLAAENFLNIWENHHLSSTAQQLGKEMDSLIRFSKYFSTYSGELELVLEKVLNELAAVIDVESCGVLLYDQDKQELILQKPAFGVKGEKFEAYKLSTKNLGGEEGIGVATKVFLSGEPYICNTVANDHVTNRKITEMYGVRSSLTVPLVVDNRRIGVIHTINKKKGSFTSNDTRLLELLAYQIARVIENVRLFGQVENKNNLLRHSMDIHNQLTKLVLRDKSLEDIIYKFSQLIERDVIVQDQFFKVLGYHLTNPLEKHSTIEKAMAEDLYEHAEYGQIIKQLHTSKQPVYLPPFPDYGLTCARLLAPITLANNILGYVSILEDQKGQLGEQHFLAIEHAATVFTLKMMQQKIAYEVEERIKGDFLDDLLNGNYRSAKDMAQRAVFLGHDLREAHQVMVMDIDNFSDFVKKQQGNEFKLSKLKRRVFEIIKNYLEEQLPACMVGTKSDTFVVIAPCCSKKSSVSPAAVAEQLRKRIKQFIPEITVSVGIGKVTGDLEKIQESYQEAKRAIAIGKRFGKKDQVITYSSLGAYKILFIAQQQEELQQFATQVLGAVIEYDREKNLNLLKTLSCYFDCNCNNQKTAEKLFIHLNTLKYRLQKIQDLTGLDLNDSEERLNMQLALKVIEIDQL